METIKSYENHANIYELLKSIQIYTDQINQYKSWNSLTLTYNNGNHWTSLENNEYLWKHAHFIKPLKNNDEHQFKTQKHMWNSIHVMNIQWNLLKYWK